MTNLLKAAKCLSFLFPFIIKYIYIITKKKPKTLSVYKSKVPFSNDFCGLIKIGAETETEFKVK